MLSDFGLWMGEICIDLEGHLLLLDIMEIKRLVANLLIQCIMWHTNQKEHLTGSHQII